MRIVSLYTRFFITVMALIICSHVVIAMLFGLIMSAKSHHPQDDRFFSTGTVLRSRLRDVAGSEERQKLTLHEISAGIELPFNAELWLTDKTGAVIDSTTGLPLPVFPAMADVRNGIGISIHRNGNPYGYIIIDCPTPSENFRIYMRTVRPPRIRIDQSFILGLCITTVIAAICLIPLIRRITVPLRSLTESANAISRGEFDKRVDEKRADELGELAKAFNMMSEKVLFMIKGTRELTANVSHQIRSPLARLSVAAEILREKTAKNDIAGMEKTITAIESEIACLDELTGKILELTKTELTLIEDRHTLTDLAAEGKAAAERYAEMIFKRKIGFTEKIAGPVQISAPPHAIQGLFDILFDNAIKYCAGGRTIRLSVRAEENRGVIEIYNTAPPCSEKMLAEIFKPFVRNESERIPGYGLGLALASHITRNLRGSIRAENMPDGICFFIDFPLVLQDTA